MVKKTKTDKLPLFSAERTAYYLTKDSSVETVREFISDMQRGWYPFDYIVKHNHPSFDINAQDKNGNTFWHYNLEICPQYKPNNITFLSNLCQATGQEIDLRRKNKKGVSVLGSLIDHPDNPLIFEDLIIYDAMYNSDNYIDYTAQNDAGVSMLMCTIKHQMFSLEDIQKLCQHPEIINLQDKDGNTALHYACRYYPSKRLISILLKNGADATIQNKKGQRPIDILKDKGNTELLSPAPAKRIAKRKKTAKSQIANERAE